jgi:hypothetical protein
MLDILPKFAILRLRMETGPNHSVDKAKQAILERCPFVRSFLDPELELNPIHQSTDTIRAAIPLVISMVFEPSVPQDVRVRTMDVLASIGYEIGDPIDAIKFLPDIKRQLESLKIVPTNTNEAQQIFIIDCIGTAIITGANWRNASSAPVPMAYRDFSTRLG